MDVGTSNNVSQSLALAAYSAQQQQAIQRPRERDNQPANANSSPETRRGDNVTFSSEALRLSAQNGQNNSRSTVNLTSESAQANNQAQKTAAPEVTRAEGAKSVAQAINAYHNTSAI